VSTVEVVHLSDPACPWAYSASPAHAVLRWRFGDQLDWRLVMIGLAEHADDYASRGYDPVRSAMGRVAFRRFGMPLAPQMRTRLMATSRGCRAVVAARMRHPGREQAVLRALQFAWFTTDALMDDDDAISDALRVVEDIDAAALVGALDDPEVTDAYEADRRQARSAAGSPTEAQRRAAATDGPVRYTAPSLLFSAGERRLEAGGFQPVEAYDVCLANLEPGLERREPAASAAEALAAFPEGLTTQEVAAVMAPHLAPVDRAAAETSLIAAQAEGAATRTPLGDDALWRPVAR
jgi:protein-disulfide isomerase-like protein with CxxC motif